MEKAVAEDLQEEGAACVLQNGLGIVPGSQDRFAVIDGNSADPFGGQHSASGPRPIDVGNVKSRVVGEVFAKLVRGSSLVSEVHLQFDRIGQSLNRFDGLDAPQIRLSRFDQFGNPEKQIYIAHEGGFNAGPENLDGDFAAIGRFGEMNLRDRGCGNRLVIKGNKKVFDGDAEFVFHGLARLGARERRKVILKVGKVGGNFLAHQIGPR